MCSQERNDSGFILLIAMIASILPLLVILGASSMTLAARQSRLGGEVEDERALLAAESAVDYAIYRASTPLGLASGDTYTRDLGNGSSFSATVTYLKTDGIDNDGDTLVDEADESLYRVLAIGSYRGVVRRIVSYLGPEPAVVGSLSGALTCLDSGYPMQMQNNSIILDGHDKKMNGTAGAGPNVPGIAVQAPTTAATALSWLSGFTGVVKGSTLTPSVGQATTPPINWNATKLAIQNAANIVLTSSTYDPFSFGDGAANQFNIIYREGNVTFKHSQGAGIMFVTGDLTMDTQVRFDGIIYVGGRVMIEGGNVNIYGAIVAGPDCPQVHFKGNSTMYYSSQAIALASAMLPGKFVLFNGWQEIARH